MSEANASQIFAEFVERNRDVAIGVAAVTTLANVIASSKANTIMGVMDDLNDAALCMQKMADAGKRTTLIAACDLFRRYVTRTSLEVPDFAKCKARLIDRGLRFAEHSQSARKKICDFGVQFIQENSVILAHGHSMVVTLLLETASKLGKQFSVIMVQSQDRMAPPAERMLLHLRSLAIPVTIIRDSAIAFFMDRIDLVLTGASSITENGGVINAIGTYQVAIVARALNRPFYVAAESYKFTRVFPLSQRDLGMGLKHAGSASYSPSESVQFESPVEDYTPPEYVTLLLTDLGIVTPSAVSDYNGSEAELL